MTCTPYPCPPTPFLHQRVLPCHVGLTLAMGDSMTVGWATGGLPLEYRGWSFSGGRGSADQLTLPYLLTTIGRARCAGASEHRNLPNGWGASRVCEGEEARVSCKLNAAVDGAGSTNLDVQHVYLEGVLNRLYADRRPSAS